MGEHHWSGWPGAFCLHCGQPDLWEIAIGRGFYDPYNERWEDSDDAAVLRDAIEKNTCPVEHSENCPQCKAKLSPGTSSGGAMQIEDLEYD